MDRNEKGSTPTTKSKRVDKVIVMRTILRNIKRSLLLFMIIMAGNVCAQVYSGDSKLFGLSREDYDQYSDIGCIRHYMSAKGESTYFVISVPGIAIPADMSKNNNVHIQYNDNTSLATKIHSSEVVKLSSPYAREKLYSTIIEFPIDRSEFCGKKRIRKIYIERDCGNIYIIETNKLWGFILNKEFPKHFDLAKSNAQKDKEQKELLADKYEMPEHILRHLEKEYPQCSYSIVHLDTVHMPLHSIMLLDYCITDEHDRLAEQIEELQNEGMDCTSLLQHGDSLVTLFKEELENYEYEYRTGAAARGDENDYLRATVELKSYEGVETITLCSRIGEENFSTIVFWEEADNCWKKIEEFEEFINWIRSQQEQQEDEAID